MNKNIPIYSYSIAIFIAVWLELCSIALPAHSQSVANNLLKEDSKLTLNIANRKSQDDLTRIIFVASLVGAGILIWRLSQSRRGTKAIAFVPAKINSDTALLDRVSPKLRRQLLRLVNDPKTVNRLLMGIYKNNRDRPPNWIAEKAIYDLRRGR